MFAPFETEYESVVSIIFERASCPSLLLLKIEGPGFFRPSDDDDADGRYEGLLSTSSKEFVPNEEKEDLIPFNVEGDLSTTFLGKMIGAL